MSLANWYVFYSYEWYATWTAFISFDKHSVTVKVRLLKCHNRGYTSSDPCYDSLFDTSGSEMRKPVVHFPHFCTIKASIYVFNVHIFHGVWQGEAIAWTSFTITHVYWILGRVLLFLFFMLMTHSLNFHHTAISVQNAELHLLSLVCHYFETWIDYSDNIKGDFMPSSFKVQNCQCSGMVDLLYSIL